MRARRGAGVLAVALCALMLSGCFGPDREHPSSSSAAATGSADPAKAVAITEMVRTQMRDAHLKSVIARVSVGGKDIIREAFGESMTGVPATVDMHFRNGAVAIQYMATLLLELVDEKKLSLDDRLSTYLPDFPHAGEVTIGQLAQMTSGYPDYVLGNDAFVKAAYDDVYRAWTPEEQLALVKDKPLLYRPGTNWNYAHTDYVLLGLVLEKVTGMPLQRALQEKVLDPLHLTGTVASQTAEIPQPALHAFTSERRPYFGIPADQSFLEESTYWNPSWTLARGSVETSTIDDLHATAIAIGTGTLLSKASYAAMTSTALRGTTTALPGCATCGVMNEARTYGIGVWISGHWLLQNPLFSGYAATEAYLPSQKVAIAVAVTFDEGAFEPSGDYPNVASTLFRQIGALLAPDDAPPTGS
ncbi:MAG: beta-lactamase family protein [Actinobacteria bacterium]|nr:beta-lactamase family protein [Actinomycetota bacterium]